MLTESLLRVVWTLDVPYEKEELVCGDGIVTLDDGTMVWLSLVSCDSFFDNYIHEVNFEDIISNDVVDLLKKHLTHELTPKLNLKEVGKIKYWKKPDYGEIILVFKINSFKSNHPEDPEEWDLLVDCIGILGEQVTLKY
jgi:hypothetical protein